jgi:hypothetical protein
MQDLAEIRMGRTVATLKTKAHLADHVLDVRTTIIINEEDTIEIAQTGTVVIATTGDMIVGTGHVTDTG